MAVLSKVCIQMPRKYKSDPTKKTYKKYDSSVLSAAVEELLLSNSTLQKVADKYNITRSVLHRHSKKYMKPPGGQTALSAEDELYIIKYINICGEWGYPIETMDLRYIVKMYLDKLGINHKRFKNNFPGLDFVQGFLNRHKDRISQRICENVKRTNTAVSSETIIQYYSELQKTLNGIPPSNIVNYDEINLTDDPDHRKVITKRSHKYPERVMNHSKISTALMLAGTAAGDMLPPYVVYKAPHLYDTWVKNGPENTRYNCSSSGWFEGKIFEDWVLNVAIPYFNKLEGQKCLIGDNLSSHLSIELIKTCKENNIDFIFLPPKSTHLTQPLYVAFFHRMELAWRQLLLKWKKTDGRTLSTVPKGCFPKLLNLLIEELKQDSKSNIKAGFKKTGIYPLNIDEILPRMPDDGQNIKLNRIAIDEPGDLLKEMSYVSMNITEPKKKRKLNDVAGQSVTAEDTEYLSKVEFINTTIKLESPSKSRGPADTTIKEVRKTKGIGKKTKIEEKTIQNSYTIENDHEIILDMNVMPTFFSNDIAAEEIIIDNSISKASVTSDILNEGISQNNNENQTFEKCKSKIKAETILKNYTFKTNVEMHKSEIINKTPLGANRSEMKKLIVTNARPVSVRKILIIEPIIKEVKEIAESHINNFNNNQQIFENVYVLCDGSNKDDNNLS